MITLKLRQLLRWGTRQRLSFLPILVLCLAGPVHCAFAKPDYPAVVRTVYRPKAGTVVDKAIASCRMCHLASPPKLNIYGEDIKTVLHAEQESKLTPAVLIQVASRDSDGDGFINETEIVADNLPGDPQNHPAGQPPTSQSASAAAENKAVLEEPLGLFHPKTLLLPDHAQHPIFVHFPVALFFASLLFDALGFWKRQTGLRFVGYANLITAAVTSPIAVITGLLAWRFRFGMSLEGLLPYHLVIGLASSALLFALWWTRAQYRRKQRTVFMRLYVFLGVLELFALSVAGHIGGALVRGF